MCAPPLSCFFRFLLKFLILRKFSTTGAGYGLFSYPKSYITGNWEIPQVRQEFDNPSIIIHFFTAWIEYFLAYFEEILFASNPGWAFKHIFWAKWFLRESAYPNFSYKKRQIPEKSLCCWWWWHISDKFSSMSPEEEFRSVEMRAQKQVVSGQSVKSNTISVVWEQPKTLLPMLCLMFFTSNI